MRKPHRGVAPPTTALSRSRPDSNTRLSLNAASGLHYWAQHTKLNLIMPSSLVVGVREVLAYRSSQHQKWTSLCSVSVGQLKLCGAASANSTSASAGKVVNLEAAPAAAVKLDDIKAALEQHKPAALFLCQVSQHGL